MDDIQIQETEKPKDMFDVEYAGELVSHENGCIDMMVKFYGFADAMPFTACETDDTEHGRELYRRAKNGDFGTIG